MCTKFGYFQYESHFREQFSENSYYPPNKISPHGKWQITLPSHRSRFDCEKWLTGTCLKIFSVEVAFKMARFQLGSHCLRPNHEYNNTPVNLNNGYYRNSFSCKIIHNNWREFQNRDVHLLSKLTHDEGKLFAVGGSFQSSHSFTENNLTIDVQLLSKMVSGKVGPFWSAEGKLYSKPCNFPRLTKEFTFHTQFISTYS